MPVAERMIALNPLVPFRDRLPGGHHLQGQRREVGQAVLDGGLRGGARRRLRAARAAAPEGAVEGGQGDDAEPLEFLEQALGERDAVVARGRAPAEMLADGLAELVAAELGQGGDRLLNVGDLLAGQPLAAESGAGEVLDALVHGWSERKYNDGRSERSCQVLGPSFFSQHRNYFIINDIQARKNEASPKFAQTNAIVVPPRPSLPCGTKCCGSQACRQKAMLRPSACSLRIPS